MNEIVVKTDVIYVKYWKDSIRYCTKSLFNIKFNKGFQCIYNIGMIDLDILVIVSYILPVLIFKRAAAGLTYHKAKKLFLLI